MHNAADAALCCAAESHAYQCHAVPCLNLFVPCLCLRTDEFMDLYNTQYKALIDEERLGR